MITVGKIAHSLILPILVGFVSACGIKKDDPTSEVKPIINVTGVGARAKVDFDFSGIVNNDGSVTSIFDVVRATSPGFSAIIAKGTGFAIEVQVSLENALAHDPVKDKNGKDVKGFFTPEDPAKPMVLSLISNTDNGFAKIESAKEWKRINKINLLITDTITTNKVIQTMRGQTLKIMVNEAIESLNQKKTDKAAKLENISALKIE